MPCSLSYKKQQAVIVLQNLPPRRHTTAVNRSQQHGEASGTAMYARVAIKHDAREKHTSSKRRACALDHRRPARSPQS